MKPGAQANVTFSTAASRGCLPRATQQDHFTRLESQSTGSEARKGTQRLPRFL